MTKKELEGLLYTALRFKSEYYGIKLDPKGWVTVDSLLYRLNFVFGQDLISKAELLSVTSNNPKFEVSLFNRKIKANIVDQPAEMIKSIPPDLLYIISSKKVNQYGFYPTPPSKCVKLYSAVKENTPDDHVWVVDSRKMFIAGHQFFLTDDGNWLTEKVSPNFISIFRRGV
jgi:putative RNA 2'-phosphotransferase